VLCVVRDFPPSEIIDEDKRLFKSWGSVEVRDEDGELVPIDELLETMEVWFQRGAPISDGDHSDKIIGKGVKWGPGREQKTGKPGVWIVGEVFKDQPYDDEVWKGVRTGKRTGLSWSGRYHKVEKTLVDGVPTRKLHGLETFAFALCEEPKNAPSTMENINFKASSMEAEEFKMVAFLARKGNSVEDIAKALKIDIERAKKSYAMVVADETNADAEASKSKKGDEMPFAGYKNYAACTRANQSKSDPEAYCAVIMRKTEDAGKAGSDEEILRTFFSGRAYSSLDKEERGEFEQIRRAHGRIGDIEKAREDVEHIAWEKAEFEKEKKEHPEFKDEQIMKIVEDHEHEKFKSKANANIVAEEFKAAKAILAGETMEDKTKSDVALPPSGAPPQAVESEEVKLLKQILALLSGQAGGAQAGAAKAEIGGPSKKLEAGAEGGKVALPESVGDKTTQESPSKNVSGDIGNVPGATMKAIQDTVAAEMNARFSSKSATPRPDAAAPASVQDSLGTPQAPQPTLGLAYDVATGTRKLTFKELAQMQTNSTKARQEAAMKAIRDAKAARNA
jgi:hypothetical protein